MVGTSLLQVKQGVGRAGAWVIMWSWRERILLLSAQTDREMGVKYKRASCAILQYYAFIHSSTLNFNHISFSNFLLLSFTLCCSFYIMCNIILQSHYLPSPHISMERLPVVLGGGGGVGECGGV